ncbi:hypothetical protein [Bradyrhizobium sp. USDA 4486]
MLLKDPLRVMAPLVLVRNSLLRPSPSWDIGWIEIVRVHASLTSKKSIELILLSMGFPEADETVAESCIATSPKGNCPAPLNRRGVSWESEPAFLAAERPSGGMGPDAWSLLWLQNGIPAAPHLTAVDLLSRLEVYAPGRSSG